MDPSEDYKNRLAGWRAEQEARKPLQEIGAKYAELAIKSLVLITGGAAVAIAGFAGGAIKTDLSQHALEPLSSAVWWFAVSAAGAVASAGLSYLSQAAALDAPEKWRGFLTEAGRFGAIAVFIFSLVGFLLGADSASTALNPKQPPQAAQPAKKTP